MKRHLVTLATAAAVCAMLAAPSLAADAVRLHRGDVTPDQVKEVLSAKPAEGVTFRGLHKEQAPTQPNTLALDIRFAFNSSELDEMAKRDLTALGEALKSPELKSARIRIEGHTDLVGTPEYNKVLSERRARAVKDFLVSSLAVDPNRLETVGRGMDDPVNPSRNDAPENRRVEFQNLSGR
jgi:OOP family OmpA-OmpF porin